MRSTKSSRRSKSTFATLFYLLLMLCFTTTIAVADESAVTTIYDDANARGSLREVITFANNHPGTRIHFDLPPSQAVNGVYRFKLYSQLPAITASRTTIDGRSQREWNGAPLIMLDGSVAGNSSGLVIQGASDCLISGLIISNFLRNGIILDSLNTRVIGGAPTENTITPATRNRIVGCYIGTDETGEIAAPNRWTGITLTSGASNNIIGGRLTAERNIISGNGQDGIFISSSPGYDGHLTSNNLVQGNFIGTNKGGSAVLRGGGNVGNGVSIWCGNRLGEPRGPQLNIVSGNLISGNGRSGVLISGRNVLQNEVRSNFIGTNRLGQTAVPNGHDGVTISREAQRNIVTRLTSGAPSIIAFNRGHGIRINGGSIRNSFLGNSIFRNVGGGITLEQPQPGEVPPNHFQAAPTLTLVQITYDPVSGASSILIKGSLSGSGSFWLEFFANESTELPQGHTLVGSVDARRDAAGNFSHSFSIPGDFTRSRITGTATSTFTSDSSGFSRGLASS